MREQVAETWFCELIRSAALAGSCSLWSRREPDAAPGLTRYAEKERRLAAALLRTNIADATGPREAKTGRALASKPTGGLTGLDANGLD